jgi:hypothetical protein
MGYCESLEGRLLLAGIVGQDLSPPIPHTTGPYIVGIYSSRQLDASSSSDPDPDESLSFAWDLDNDNIFGESGAAAGNGDEIGAMPTFFANATAKGTYPIKLKVTDSSGLSSDLTTSITIHDSILNGTSGNDSWRISLNPSNIVDFYENAPPDAPPTFSIPFNKVGFIRVTGGDGDDTCSMDYPFPMNLNLGAGNDTMVMTAGSGWADDPQGYENLVVSGTAWMDLRRLSYRFSSLTLSGSGKVGVSGTDTFLHLGSLSISDNATLDLAHGVYPFGVNTLIVDSGDIVAISALVNSGRILPTWSFVVSPHTLDLHMGARVNSNPLRTSFAGESNLTGGEILVRGVRGGDVNFDDQVTIADLIDLASHFGQSPASWGDGDSDRDGVVSISDFIYLASHIGSSSATATVQPALSSAINRTSIVKKKRQPGSHHHITPRIFSLPRAYWLGNR